MRAIHRPFLQQCGCRRENLLRLTPRRPGPDEPSLGNAQANATKVAGAGRRCRQSLNYGEDAGPKASRWRTSRTQLNEMHCWIRRDGLPDRCVMDHIRKMAPVAAGRLHTRLQAGWSDENGNWRLGLHVGGYPNPEISAASADLPLSTSAVAKPSQPAIGSDAAAISALARQQIDSQRRRSEPMPACQ